MIQLYENMSEDSADLCGLILRASDIPFRARRDSRGWGIWVHARDYDRARGAVEQYFMENRGPGPEADTAAEYRLHGYAGIWAAAMIAAVYVAVSGRGDAEQVWSDFGASAAKIADGELYRVVTALFLHADGLHLLGNMAGLAVFATAVCHVAGWGAGILMVVFAGASGNMINAWLYEYGHLSIGASTSVFGAIGILSGYQFFRKRRDAGRKAAAWVPLGCGMALLGFLGTGERVDLTAHLFGFLAGVVIGIGYGMAGRIVPMSGQRICFLAACAVMAGAWAAGAWMN
ncbi:MAG: rhomboid family intramembrane serine protease [Desulfosalsimonas sp.]